MALISFAGFEDNNLVEVLAIGNASVVTTSPRTGTYCLYGPGAQSTPGVNGWAMVVDRDEFYVQYAIKKYSATHGTDDVWCYLVRDSLNQSLIQFYWRNATNTVDVYTGSKETLIGSTTTPFTTGWKVVEMYIKVSSNETTGKFALKIDGRMEVDFTGITQPGACLSTVHTVRHTGLCDFFFLNNGNLYYDDIIINDTTGDSFNSWPSGIKIHKIAAPTSNGYYSEWTPIGASNNYECIDDTTPSMTDYIEGVTYNKDCYAFGDSPISAGIVAVAARYYGQGGGTVKRLCRYDGTDFLSAGLTIPSAFNKVDDIMYEKPGGGEWDAETFNACEFGVEQE